MDRTTAVALVDYANSILSGDGSGSLPAFATCARIQERIIAFTDAIIQNVMQHCPSVEDLRIRLYAGWSDSDGRDTPSAVCARSYLSKLPRRHGSIRTLTNLAQDLACRPAKRLHGTFRGGGQKMVDGMIIVDTLHYLHKFGNIILVSDDEDFSPVMMAASSAPRARANLFWYRRRGRGECVNDHNVPCGEVVIEHLEKRP